MKLYKLIIKPIGNSPSAILSNEENTSGKQCISIYDPQGNHLGEFQASSQEVGDVLKESNVQDVLSKHGFNYPGPFDIKKIQDMMSLDDYLDYL